MKDYSLNKEQRDLFILNYKVEDKNIILNFASGKEKEIPYSIENEKKVLNYMKEQVMNYKEFVEKQELLKIRLDFLLSLSTVVFMYNTLFSISIAPEDTFTKCVISISALIIVYNLVLKKRVNDKLADLEKNKYFLQNEDTINNKLDDMKNMNTLPRLKKYFEKEFNSSTQKEKVYHITLNDLDDMSLEELVLFVNQNYISEDSMSYRDIDDFNTKKGR